MKSTAFFVVIVVICSCATRGAAITSGGLASYRSMFLKKIIADNPMKEAEVRSCMNGFLLDGNRGIRLLDAFALYQYTMAKKGIEVQQIWFDGGEKKFLLFIVMKDTKDDQRYTLFVSYDVLQGCRCVLKDLLFSIVFEEQIQETRRFFETR